MDPGGGILTELFGKGPAAEWVTLVYFLAGALGTAGRVWLSTTIENRGRRMVVETLSGGCGGIILPYLGTAWLPGSVWTFPPIVRAAVIFLVAGSGSLITGEIIARFKGKAT